MISVSADTETDSAFPTVSAQIKGHSWLDRHFFALKVHFLELFQAKIGKILIYRQWKTLKVL